MATTSSRILSLFIVLLVGAIGACAPKGAPEGGPPPHPTPVHPPFDAEGTNAVLVGPAAKDLTIPKLYLWKDTSHDDVAVWVATDPKTTLYIDFKDEIFEGMTQPSPGVYRVQCVGSRCDSGKIKEGIQHPVPPKDYKYTQTLVDSSGKADSYDGMIQIKP